MKYWHDGNRFSITGQAFESTYIGLDGAQQVNNINTLTYKGLLLSAKQDFDFNNVTVKWFTDFNRFSPNFLVNDFPSFGNKGGFKMANNGQGNYRLRAGTQLAWTINTAWEWFVGLEWEKRATEAYQVYNQSSAAILGSIMPKFSVNEKSLYSQLDYSLDEQWNFIIGGRYINNDIIGQDLAPRLAAIYKFNTHHSIKALYSVGFNVPSFTQLKADFGDIVVGNPNLNPEKVKTIDFAYTYANENTLMVANIFQLKAEDFIFSDRSTGTINFFNAQPFTRYGAEIDLTYQINRKWRLFSNLSYHYQGNSKKVSDTTLTYVPKTTANMGSEYLINREQKIGSSLRYLGARSTAKALILWNVDYQYVWYDVILNLTLENMLDQTILHPNMAEFNDRLIPAGQGRNVKLGVSYPF